MHEKAFAAWVQNRDATTGTIKLPMVTQQPDPLLG